MSTVLTLRKTFVQLLKMVYNIVITADVFIVSFVSLPLLNSFISHWWRLHMQLKLVCDLDFFLLTYNVGFMHRVSLNCYYKIRGVIVPIETSNNFHRTSPFERQKRALLEFLHEFASSVGKANDRYQKLHKLIYLSEKNS